MIQAALDFTLSAKSPQKPPTARRRIVVTLLCPKEDCGVAMKATLTIPAAKAGGKAKKVKLKRATFRVTKATKERHSFAFARAVRVQVARALRSARTRKRVKVLVTAVARNSAGRTSTKTTTVRVRR